MEEAEVEEFELNGLQGGGGRKGSEVGLEVGGEDRLKGGRVVVGGNEVDHKEIIVTDGFSKTNDFI